MPRATSNGISYAEVMHALREVAKTWNCRLQFVMTLPISQDSGKQCDVRIAMLRPGEKGRWDDVGGISRPWPSVGHQTMTGLLLALVYELDAQLQRKKEEAEAQPGQFRLRAF